MPDPTRNLGQVRTLANQGRLKTIGGASLVVLQLCDEIESIRVGALAALMNWNVGPYERIHLAHLALGDTEHEWCGDEDDL